MKSDIIKRVIDEANYMVNTNRTIREIAFVFNVSKSTVHKDLKDRLKFIDNDLYGKVQIIIKNHLNIRHIRGGESTKRKYQILATKNECKKH
ncbi:MAG: sporulation transcriptional regulator SpoIIID [Bacilli bacterium]|nr:sporulation transcriptional regulator SpoIIID [Bacilli bacterium]